MTENVALGAYRAFIAAKSKLAVERGLPCEPSEVNPWLKPFQRDIVAWSVRGGRRAIFARFGSGKTPMQLEVLRLILAKLGRGRGLIVLPLGVRQEFVRDAATLAIPVRFVQADAEVAGDGIYLTNYESVREGKLNPTQFDVVSLDEAACLRGFGGTKTFREFMRYFEGSGTFRFVATATPSPNEFIELLAYAAFLDVIDVSQGKTRWFRRNSEKADALTLHPHKEEEFWLWVATWAILLQRPSDLGYSDDGYELLPLDVQWHVLPSDPARAGADSRGQGRMFVNKPLGVVDASREKRASLLARVDRAVDLTREHLAAEPDSQIVVWCDLNDEQRALERAFAAAGISCSSLDGSQSIDAREALLEAWRDRQTTVFLTKPSMYGAGVNLQQAHVEIFSGIGFKFAELIQAIHRIHRYLQTAPCTVHLIYTEAETDVRLRLIGKWRRHDDLVEKMTSIIRAYGLGHAALNSALTRSERVDRREETGEAWTLVQNDCVEETHGMGSDSVDLILTSIPFSTMYEYSPSYLDFGHTDDERHFWAQMDFLTPQLLRVTKPGRNLVVHVKDRVVPSGLTKLGFQTVQPFHADAIRHYMGHGWAYLGMITIVTDVVRENAQTNRLGWSEQCKDGTRMGVGVPEYLLLFRKPVSDPTRGYADEPVLKAKPWCDDRGTPAPFDPVGNWKHPIPGTGYSRARWQFDAHGFWRSGGDRLLSGDEVADLTPAAIYQLWRRRSTQTLYDIEAHVRVAEALDHLHKLPASFMLVPPHSWHPDVWTDIMRARTLNNAQLNHGRQMHLCPLPLDIVTRIIQQRSQAGELVYDPFAGLGTVPLQAVKLGRRGLGVELSAEYFADAVGYLRATERGVGTPTFFDLLAAQDAAEAEDVGRPGELDAAAKVEDVA